MEAIVTYLDILGFKEYVATDIVGASRLLGAHQTTLTRLHDQLHNPPNKYSDAECRDLAHRHLADSFQHFLPFSDSIFIIGTDPSLLVEQLSTFLVDAFMLEGHAFAQPDEPSSPTKQRMTVFDVCGTGQRIEHWFPALWRGGVTFGDVHVSTIPMIHDHWPRCGPVPFGKAVVEAVGLEGSGKGPRLFCSEAAAERISGQTTRLVISCEECRCKEILWPVSKFTMTNDPEVEKSEFLDLFLPARSLWLSKVGTNVEQHYWEFLRLICRSALHWANHVNAGPSVIDYMSAKIREHILPEYSSKLLLGKLR